MTSAISFDVTDYGVIAILLIVYTAILLYYSYVRETPNPVNGQEWQETTEFLLGGRNMNPTSISMSLLANKFTAMHLLIQSINVYLYGYHYYYTSVAIIPVAAAMHYCVLPIFHELKCISIFEYLERRFSRKMRIYGALMYLLCTFCSVVTLTTMALFTFQRVIPGFNGAHVIVITTYIVFLYTLYSFVEGLRSIISIDKIQCVLLYGILVVVILAGISHVGGLGQLIHKSIETKRINTPLFKNQTTFLGTFICYMFMHLRDQILQSSYQRYVSLPTVDDARRALWKYVAGYMLLSGFTSVCGLLLHVTYNKCDNFGEKLDIPYQLIPHFILETIKHIPFFCGLFLIASISCSLIPSTLNTMSGVIFEDWIKSAYRNQLTGKRIAYILRCTAAIIGAVMLILIIALEFSWIVQFAFVITSFMSLIIFNIFFGVFIIGATMPWISSKATGKAAMLAIPVIGVIVFVDLIHTNFSQHAWLPTMTEECSIYSIFDTNFEPFETFLVLYHTAILHYPFVGCLVTILLANLIWAIFSRKNPHEFDRSMLVPQVKKFWEQQEPQEAQLDSVMTNEFEFTEISLETVRQKK